MSTSVKLNDNLKRRIKSLAQTKDRMPHWVMREAISDYVAREEAKESFKQEAMASWQAYRETGQPVTGSEIANWLDTWGSDKESEPLECHD